MKFEDLVATYNNQFAWLNRQYFIDSKNTASFEITAYKNGFITALNNMFIELKRYEVEDFNAGDYISEATTEDMILIGLGEDDCKDLVYILRYRDIVGYIYFDDPGQQFFMRILDQKNNVLLDNIISGGAYNSHFAEEFCHFIDLDYDTLIE